MNSWRGGPSYFASRTSEPSPSVKPRIPDCPSDERHADGMRSAVRFAMPAGSSSPTIATTRAPCSTTSGTGTSSTRSGTPTWRPIGSRTFGGTDDGGAGSIAPARKIRPFEEDDAPYRRDQSPAGGRILRGVRSCGPIAVSTSIISRFGLRLDDSFSGDCPPGAGSAAGSAFISTRCALPTA